MYRFLCISILLAGCISCMRHNTVSRESALAGLYKLHIMEIKDSTGVWREDDWMKGGTTHILYDGVGHMALQMIPAGYDTFDWVSEKESVDVKFMEAYIDSMDTESLREAVKQFSSYYGYLANVKLSDTADIAIHDRFAHTNPECWHTEAHRAFSFSGDTLVLQLLNGSRRLLWLKQP